MNAQQEALEHGKGQIPDGPSFKVKEVLAPMSPQIAHYLDKNHHRHPTVPKRTLTTGFMTLRYLCVHQVDLGIVVCG